MTVMDDGAVTHADEADRTPRIYLVRHSVHTQTQMPIEPGGPPLPG
jgi:hypothetical protein